MTTVGAAVMAVAAVVMAVAAAMMAVAAVVMVVAAVVMAVVSVVVAVSQVVFDGGWFRTKTNIFPYKAIAMVQVGLETRTRRLSLCTSL